MEWCAQTFPPISWIFAIFDRNFAKIVVPPSDKNENYIVYLYNRNGFIVYESILRKALKTASKSGDKRQRNACSNYAPLERTVLRTRSVTNKQTPHFRTYSRRAWCDLPQTLHGDSARRANHKCHHSFLIQRIVFPTGCTEKVGLIYRRAVSRQ